MTEVRLSNALLFLILVVLVIALFAGWDVGDASAGTVVIV